MTVQRKYDASTPAGHCAYCGAPLNAFYYFCLRCATPYKALETVAPGAQPRPLGDEERIRLMAPHVWTIFGVYALVTIVSFLIAFGVFREDNIVAALLTATIAIFITTCVFASIYWRSLIGQFRTFGFNRWEAWAGIGVLAPLLAVNWGYHGIFEQLMPHSHQSEIQRLLDAGIGYPALVVLFCLFPAVTEEIAFRGLVQHWLQIAIAPWKGLVLAAAIFMALHFSVISAPYLFLVGLLLGYVKQRTGSLYPSMLIHFLHNLVVITLFHM